MDINNVFLVGRLTQEPTLKFTKDKLECANISIAINTSYNPANTKQIVDFIPIVLWKQEAKYICEFAKKGTLLCIQGKLKQNVYTDNNNQKQNKLLVVGTNVYILKQPIAKEESDYFLKEMEKRNAFTQKTKEIENKSTDNIDKEMDISWNNDYLN